MSPFGGVSTHRRMSTRRRCRGGGKKTKLGRADVRTRRHARVVANDGALLHAHVNKHINKHANNIELITQLGNGS